MNWNGVRRHWPAALAALLGIIASLAVFHRARYSAEQRVSTEFAVEAETRAHHLQEVLSRYEGTLEGFAAVFPQHLDADEFRAYAKSIFLAANILQSGFHSAAWAPRVEDRDRAAFEAAARAEGFTGFAISDLAPDGNLIAAPQRPEYYPLRYIEPLQPDAPLGFDMATDKVRAAAMQRAIATGAMIATPELRMVSGAEASLLYVPVYPNSGDIEPRSGDSDVPTGILSFRMSLSATIDAVIASFEPRVSGVDLYVVDDTEPQGHRLIYSSLAPGADTALLDEAQALAEPHWGSAFRFAARDLTFILRVSPQILAERAAGAGRFELGAGLLLTAMLALYLISSRARADRLRRLADKLQREVAMRRSTEEVLSLTQAAMDRSSEAICLVEPSGRYLNVNDATCRQLGYTREEMLQRVTVFDVDPRLTANLWAERWQSFVAAGSLTRETHRQTNDGRMIPVDLTVSYFQFRAKEYLFLVARDVTARRALEHELRDARDRAETANHSKSQFLANMSHELRTPLNAIIGFSEVISSALFGPLDARYRDYAQDIHGSGHHLLRIINDLLDLSKVEAGRLELHDGTVQIAALFETCRRMMDDRAAAGGIILEIEANDIEISGDELRLEQVLLNLVSNAVKFTPAGGTIRVAAGLNPAGGVTVSVADTGIGMAANEIPRAMQPFGQIDNTLVRPIGGTGLGLPLAARLVELHGGTLTVESEPGRGTTVTFTLPPERTHHREMAAEFAG